MIPQSDSSKEFTLYFFHSSISGFEPFQHFCHHLLHMIFPKITFTLIMVSLRHIVSTLVIPIAILILSISLITVFISLSIIVVIVLLIILASISLDIGRYINTWSPPQNQNQSPCPGKPVNFTFSISPANKCFVSKYILFFMRNISLSHSSSPDVV